MTTPRTGLTRGVNLNGWLSQCDLRDDHHLERYITSDDFARLAKWGANHVRVPVDFRLIESSSSPRLLPRGIALLDNAVLWSRRHGLKLILALNGAPGMEFDDDAAVYSEVDIQRRFVTIWRRLAAHYNHSDAKHVVFEILNAPAPPTRIDWLSLARMAVNAIRSVAPERSVIVGPTHYLPGNLLNMGQLNDPHIMYAFNFYQPLIFTHQRTHGTRAPGDFDLTVDYPCTLPDLTEYARGIRVVAMREDVIRYSGAELDRDLLEAALMSPRIFRRRVGAPVHCVEFGVSDNAPLESRKQWLADVMQLLALAGIGWTHCAYKGPFGLVDDDGVEKEVRETVFPACIAGLPPVEAVDESGDSLPDVDSIGDA